LSISAIKVSELEGHRRFDAEYYQPNYLELIHDLEKAHSRSLSEIAKIQKRKFEPISGRKFNYIEISEVNTETGRVNAIEILGEEAPSRAQHIVQAGDVIISSVRPNRNAVALITKNLSEFVCSSGFVVLRPRNVPAEFLFITLKTSFVRTLLNRQTTATMYPAVSETDLIDTPVIIPSDKIIGLIVGKVQKATQLQNNADNLFTEAEQLLSAELGLDRLDLSEGLFNVRQVSEVLNASRMDAEFYQEKYYRLEIAIKEHKYPHKPLSKLIEPIINGFDFREFTEEGTPYIRVGDVRNGRIDFDNAAKIPIKRDEVQKDVGIRIGDVLFTRKGTFGNAAVVREGQEQAIISSEIMLLRLQKHLETPILADYLALFLNSKYGYQQVTRKVHGVAYYSISQPDLAQVWVIAPPMNIQERLAGKIQASSEAEKNAKHLLSEAKSEVERLIEGKNRDLE
jgi:restriction endonuclease S subunit